MLVLLGMPLLVVLIICVIFCMFNRRFGLAAIFALLVILDNSYFKLFAINAIGNNDDSARTIRVMTYNVNGWGNWQNGWKDKQELLEWIRTQDVDVLSIQEFMTWEASDFEDSLCKYFPYSNNVEIRSSYVEPLTFSKYPIVLSERISEHVNSVDIVVEDDTINVISCYMPSNNISKAKCITDCYHLIENGYSERNKQVDLLSKKVKNRNTIILGDLNDVSGSYSLKTLESLGFKDAWWHGGFGLGLTYSKFPICFRLDHILNSKGLVVRNVCVPHVIFSDHYPVVADFTISKKNER